MKRYWLLNVIAFSSVFFTAHIASAEEDLSAFTSLGYMGSSGTNGTAVTAGLRLGVGRHVALSLDVGYGVLDSPHKVEDRWWIIPSLAFVIPTRIAKLPTHFDLGIGIGLGASSSYATWSEYFDKPFMPDWAVQLVPTIRAHATAAISVKRDLDIFLRADAASLILPAGTGTTTMDTTWLMLSLGAQFRLL